MAIRRLFDPLSQFQNTHLFRIPKIEYLTNRLGLLRQLNQGGNDILHMAKASALAPVTVNCDGLIV